MLLRHLHLPGLTPYTRAAALQSTLVSALLTHKSQRSASSPSSSSSPLSSTPAPLPTIITAEFQPVYTCGRREIPSMTSAQIAHLTAKTPQGAAEFQPALRGGQTTFHGPGQLVAYPVLDLRAHGLSARSYVCALEKSVVAVCAEHGVAATAAGAPKGGEEEEEEEGEEDLPPGVWVRPDAKICALGVHLRRNVASHGIGLNVHTDLRWFERIVACGLEGKSTTSLEREGAGAGLTVRQVGREFVRVLGERLEGVDGVVEITADEVVGGG